jgi:aminodeoxyfutalosine synthase
MKTQDFKNRDFKINPLSEVEALFLFEKAELSELMELAHQFKQKLYGDQVFWVNNRQINYTNICVLKCKFCAFSKITPESPEAYDWSIPVIIQKVQEACDLGARELHIVGGLHPDHPFEYYLELLSTIRQKFPAINIKAFTAIEILHFSKISHYPVIQVLELLKASGLNAMTGGGAEIFDPEVRKKICGPKETAEEWAEVHRLAHHRGIRSNATMLFGHIETYAHRIDHMRRLRNLQSETGGFYSFIPLVFHPENTNLRHLIPQKTSVEDRLRTIAVARLFLHNIPHIKAYWVMLGLDVAERALHGGASDLDGTILEERITQAAGAETPVGMSRSGIIEMITRQGLVPAERDALYHTYS